MLCSFNECSPFFHTHDLTKTIIYVNTAHTPAFDQLINNSLKSVSFIWNVAGGKPCKLPVNAYDRLPLIINMYYREQARNSDSKKVHAHRNGKSWRRLHSLHPCLIGVVSH